MRRLSGPLALSTITTPITAAPLTAALAAALALGLITAPRASAQIMAEIDLDEITVSANLVPTEIQRSGASVSVIERDEIEQSGVTQVSDLLARLPGVSMTRDGGPGSRTSLRIRGAGPGYTAVFVDGIRIDDPSSTSVGTDFGHMTLDEIDRIEVLRGSQSAPYGGSAVAGVINITTTRPQRDGFSHSMFAEGGSYGSAAAGYRLRFRDARLETSLTLTHRRSDGFSAWEGIPGTPDFNPDAAPDGFEATRLSLSARYMADNGLTLGVSAFYQASRNDYDPFDDSFAVQPDEDAEARWQQFGLRFSGEYDTGATTHLLGAGFYSIGRDTYEFGSFLRRFEGQRLTLDYQGVREISPALTLVWGADAMQETVTSESIPAGQTTLTLGAFGQALWSPNAQLDLGATARFDNNSDYGNFLTGRLTAAWQATPDTTLRAAAGRGFRPPSLDERFGVYPSFLFAGNPDLEPETSLSAEIGLDHRLAGGAQVSATLFWLATDNRIGSVPCPLFDSSCAPGILSTLDNFAGTSPRYGLELSGSMPLTERLSLTGSYTWTEAENPDGSRMARVPRHDLSLGLEADLAAQWRGSVSVQHVADRPDESDFSTWPAPPVSMPDYTVVNATLRYAVTANADIYLRAENLFDAQYQHSLGYATAGRSFHLGVAARF